MSIYNNVLLGNLFIFLFDIGLIVVVSCANFGMEVYNMLDSLFSYSPIKNVLENIFGPKIWVLNFHMLGSIALTRACPSG